MTEKRANGSHAANGGHKQVWPKKPASPSPRRGLTEAEIATYSRMAVATLLLILAFALKPFVQPRIVDPLNKWLIIDPIIGLLMYWPLSRVLIRASSLFWGHLLALLPTAILLYIRFFANQRDAVFGNQPNLPFGAMIFLGVCSMAAYLLFRTPPRH